MNAAALSLAGSDTTVGFPLSPSSPMFGCRGMSPRKSTWCSAQRRLALSLDPKTLVASLQWGQVKSDMFCTRPRMSTWTVLNMLMPLTASFVARVWGVVTMTDPGHGQQAVCGTGRLRRLAVEHGLLGDCQLRVSRAGRQIQHEDVEAAPVDFVEQLLYRLHDHGAPPHDGGLFRDEVAH